MGYAIGKYAAPSLKLPLGASVWGNKKRLVQYAESDLQNLSRPRSIVPVDCCFLLLFSKDFVHGLERELDAEESGRVTVEGNGEHCRILVVFSVRQVSEPWELRKE